MRVSVFCFFLSAILSQNLGQGKRWAHAQNVYEPTLCAFLFLQHILDLLCYYKNQIITAGAQHGVQVGM